MAEGNVKKDWSVLVYMAANAGDEKLRKAALLNLRQMKSIGSNDNVWVAAEAHLPNELTRRYLFPAVTGNANEQQMNVIEMGGCLNSADPTVLADFLKWGKENCPAKKVMLIFWGHGYGLDDFDPFPGKKSLPKAPVAVMSYTGAKIETSEDTIFGFGGDISSGSYLQNSQIAETLKEGGPLSVLAFDCCDMSLIEVWAEMKSSASIGLGSQYGVPYAGWPYHLVLKHLLDKSEMNPQQVAAMVVETYIDYWDQQKTKPPTVVTLSACDLTKTDSLLNVIKPLAAALIEQSRQKDGRAKIFASRNVSPIFDEDGFIDLGAFCRQLQFNFPNSDVSVASDAVCAALTDYVTTSKFAPKATQKKISLSTGVSVWFPPWIQYPESQILEKGNSERYLFGGGYSSTTFAAGSDWDQFLKALLHFTRHNSKLESIMAVSKDNEDNSSRGKPGDHYTGRHGNIFTGRQSPTLTGRSAEGGVFKDGSSHEAGVVVRATVESFGAVGDTELNVTVRWPASNNAVNARRENDISKQPEGVTSNVEE